MTTEQTWHDLPTLQEVACAQADGWEIEVNITDTWRVWQGHAWDGCWKFRARPRQPKTKRVKQVCFFLASGIRYDLIENSRMHLSIKDDKSWIRVPSEDKTIEVPA